MKLHEVMYGDDVPLFKQWQQACRSAFPSCTFTGTQHQSQAVDWNSPNNEVAGDWNAGKGVVYKPGSSGREVLEQIG
jgi:hypothetical protein